MIKRRLVIYFSLAIVLLVLGYIAYEKVSYPQKLSALKNPFVADLEWCQKIVPKAVSWYLEQEALLAANARGLTNDEIEMAKQIGVQQPEKVKVVQATVFPIPNDNLLSAELKKTRLWFS